MRTTLAIDDDVLAVAKTLAAQQQKSIGQVVSELARQGLRPKQAPPRQRNGIPLLARGRQSPPVTMELVNQLRDDAP